MYVCTADISCNSCSHFDLLPLVYFNLKMTVQLATSAATLLGAACIIVAAVLHSDGAVPRTGVRTGEHDD